MIFSHTLFEIITAVRGKNVFYKIFLNEASVFDPDKDSSSSRPSCVCPTSLGNVLPSCEYPGGTFHLAPRYNLQDFQEIDPNENVNNVI